MLGTKLRLTGIGRDRAGAAGAASGRIRQRHENADYLKRHDQRHSCITPYVLSPGVTRAAFHLFPFRYDGAAFGGLPLDLFLKAMRPRSTLREGYSPLNTMPYVKQAFQTKNFRRMYAPSELDYGAWLERRDARKTTASAARRSGSAKRAAASERTWRQSPPRSARLARNAEKLAKA
jgi:hypothetical protein